ncbi:uncharacterized protein TRAVEDRAFT_61761 [Trametes versicolor FP-101664 SS1]|uniref:uncharacterized protein n=1 Tax=Trametes versicolor (strain FP-101664) TaxID=717944 RepID=UPI0004624288|nr:uncharacterized protein TRAVEDRAFT_61761 [Trametes versicolor FP-101664 SS1]EIW63916.1 hypothetical protein TRAVEDRAFT_61761 [Trametes versicolor FP-101664 SS1]
MPYAGPSDAGSTATATRPSSHRRTRSASNFSDERGPGAFAPLGQLPRLNKKAVFHLNNDNDDDNANDDEPRPTYPTYTSPYSPINSLRLSMNAGKFSPSIDPPSRIDIPPLEPPTSVPFPTSSPISPSSGASPFFNNSFRFSSKPSSPSLPRTPSTPIILSNGKPLKSSLKSSASTPNILDLPVKHIRTQSAPATPNTNKNVHFAEKDSGLETVRVYNRTGKPASLSKPPGEETETETEAESSFPFPLLPSSPLTVAPAAIMHEIDPSPDRSHPIPKTNPSPYANVLLETLALPRTRPPTLRGTVLVRNISFEKVVAVRFTLDDWQTTSEVLCKHVVSLPGLPPPFPRARTMGDVAANIASGNSDDEKEAAGPSWDRFSFTIRLEDYEAKLADRTLYLVVRYNPGCGGEWWDNNDDRNYRVGFRRASASPLPSPSLSSLGMVHSQQRTFSAPSTLKTTPTTGSVPLPFVPSRQMAMPLAPQLTRSLSSPFPAMSPSFNEVQGQWKEREQGDRQKMSEHGLGSPTAAYLSKKLSLSNYVAPSTSSAMVTPPITPPGTVRMRSASLPTEAGMSADEPKPSPPAEDKPKSDEHPATTSIPVQPASLPDFHGPAPSSWAGPSSPSASSSTPPAASTLASIPGPSPAALAAQARSYRPTSYGYPFQQLMSPPQSKDSSPAGSGNASPRRGSPEPRKLSALGLEGPIVRSESPAPVVNEEERKAAAALSTAVRELGLNASPGTSANANARVDTSDPSYAALLRQWCFAQSAPPAPASGGHASPSGSPSPRIASAAAAAALDAMAAGSGNTTPKVGFGAGSGYGFPGFSFGLPDAGMVGARMQ